MHNRDALLVGVYCVCGGRRRAQDSGLLTFVSRTWPTSVRGHTIQRLKPPFRIGNLPIRLKPGQLVLFPSWLLHEVTSFEPAEGEGLRITVAFNARFRMEGVPPPQVPEFRG